MSFEQLHRLRDAGVDPFSEDFTAVQKTFSLVNRMPILEDTLVEELLQLISNTPDENKDIISDLRKLIHSTDFLKKDNIGGLDVNYHALIRAMKKLANKYNHKLRNFYVKSNALHKLVSSQECLQLTHKDYSNILGQEFVPSISTIVVEPVLALKSTGVEVSAEMMNEAIKSMKILPPALITAMMNKKNSINKFRDTFTQCLQEAYKEEKYEGMRYTVEYSSFSSRGLIDFAQDISDEAEPQLVMVHLAILVLSQKNMRLENFAEIKTLSRDSGNEFIPVNEDHPMYDPFEQLPIEPNEVKKVYVNHPLLDEMGIQYLRVLNLAYLVKVEDASTLHQDITAVYNELLGTHLITEVSLKHPDSWIDENVHAILDIESSKNFLAKRKEAEEYKQFGPNNVIDRTIHAEPFIKLLQDTNNIMSELDKRVHYLSKEIRDVYHHDTAILLHLTNLMNQPGMKSLKQLHLHLLEWIQAVLLDKRKPSTINKDLKSLVTDTVVRELGDKIQGYRIGKSTLDGSGRRPRVYGIPNEIDLKTIKFSG